MDLAYGAEAAFRLESLCVDEWDRFHGLSENSVPFVFSRTAQVEFFDFLDSFDDDSITDRRHALFNSRRGSRLPEPPSGSGFWTNIYQTETPGWELGTETPILPVVLPQLKLSKCRVLVLGCGSGHDAAYLARQGFVVTAVDFSEEAIQRARANYASQSGLTIVQADAFNLPEKFNASFDLVFEHTFYCAVSPDRRDELVDQWRRVLTPVVSCWVCSLCMKNRVGPPFGGSEWESARRALEGDRFNILYWTRWRQSIEARRSKELVVFAKSSG